MAAASINNVIGKRFIELLSVDSTNNYAMQQVHSGTASHGDVYFAFEQTAGRGQFNKQWLSGKGENVILSVVLGTAGLELSCQFLLNMITALSTRQLFNKYTTENVKIKWPNDIYCRDRKAAGILIENLIRGKTWLFAIVGIGVNINQTRFSEGLKNPISLKQLTGKSYNVVELARELCILLEGNLKMLYDGRKNDILESYNQQLYKLNEAADFKEGTAMFSGVVKEVDEMGNIIIDSGVKRTYRSGQLEWLH